MTAGSKTKKCGFYIFSFLGVTCIWVFSSLFIFHMPLAATSAMMSCPGLYFLVFDMSDCICWLSSKMRVNSVPHWLQSNFNWSNGADNLNHRDMILQEKVFSLLHMSRACLLLGNYWNFLSWQLSKKKYHSLHPSTCTRLNYTDIIPYVGPLGLISIGEGILLVDTKWQLLKNKLNKEMCKKTARAHSMLAPQASRSS